MPLSLFQLFPHPQRLENAKYGRPLSLVRKTQESKINESTLSVFFLCARLCAKRRTYIISLHANRRKIKVTLEKGNASHANHTPQSLWVSLC